MTLADDRTRIQELESLRVRIRPLLHLAEPADALYAYYALYHDPRRTRLHVHRGGTGQVSGFVAVCQTGQRLFEPTVLLRTPDARAAVALLHEALVPGRPYHVITTPDLREAVAQAVDVEQSQVNHLYRLEMERMPTEINVLVVTERGAESRPRFVIRSQLKIAAESGVNWDSPHFAEVFVHTEPASRGRGWGRAVLTACTSWVIQSARQPLYVVEESNEPGIALARTVGYVDTGSREFSAEGVHRA